MMDSNTSYNSHDEYIRFEDKNNESDSRLLRFRSAPESLFANLTDGIGKSSSSNAKGNNIIVSSQNGYGSMNSQLPPQYPRQSSSTGDQFASSIDGGFINRFMGSSLMRQNSSPPGLFSHLNSSQNDYSAIRGVGGNTDVIQSSSSIKNEMNNYPSDFGILSRLSEAENGDETSSNEIRDDQPRVYSNSRFPFGSTWNNSSSNFISGLRKESAELRNEGGPPMLSHHLSLPTSSAEMAEMEKLLHFQDTVPCKLRAKRGFATHPRSIAERVRRTRISERMRKLQDLVPNMDKQTNTADMLDFAVDYIKDLREQYKTLNNIRAKCKCSPLKKQVSNQTS